MTTTPQNTAPTAHPTPTFTTAPLVQLIDADPMKMSLPELEQYLTNIRALRASPQTTRAKTERKQRVGAPSNQAIDDICG